MKLLAEITIPFGPWVKRMDCEAKIKNAISEALNMIPGFEVRIIKEVEEVKAEVVVLKKETKKTMSKKKVKK